MVRVVVWVTLAACHPEPEPLDGVAFDAETRTLTLARDGVVLLEMGPGDLEIGAVDVIEDRRSYDPWWEDAVDVDWRELESAEPLDGGASLRFEGGVTGRLEVAPEGEDRFAMHLTVDAGAPVAFFRLTARMDRTEGLYGLGEFFDTPNHRGRSRAMQIEIDTSLEGANNEAHARVPLLIGTTGWGWFVEDHHPMRFDCATDADDRVTVTVGTGVDTADGLRFHWYSADHPLDVTRHYYATTGAVRLPAPWALGPWLWRDESRDQAEVEADIATLRALDLATSGIWIDRPYATGVNTFDFDPAKYEDPSALIARAHAAGLRVALWHTPYADPESAPDFYAVADSQGYFPPAAPPPFTWSLPLDFTNPDARAWWQQWIDAYTMLGIEGYKLDYAEDVLVVGSAGGRLPWSFFDGSDERTMHSKYQLLYHEVYAETLPSEGGFLLTRTARYGDQANGVIVWPGDIDADLSSFGEVVTDDHGDTYGAVGGLPSAVVASVSLGPSGLPFFGSDTGGYRHAPPTKETFTRWFQHTALSTVMQVGTNANDLPWEGGRGDEPFDAEMLGWYRDYARLHLRLWPYLWTHVAALESTGRPILRPVGFAFPELGQHPPHDYLVGDDLLVAPVVVAGARTRDVVVPPGAWIDWFTGDVLTGPGARTVDAPLDRLPLFLRAGGVVPLLRPTVDTLSPATDPDVDTVAADKGVLWARTSRGPASTFVLYDGAAIGQSTSGGDVTLTWRGGDAFDEGAVVEVIGFVAASATVDGAPLPAGDGESSGFRVSDGSTWVRVPPGAATVTLRAAR